MNPEPRFHLHLTSLPGNTIDEHQTIEAHAHHAIRRSRRTADRGMAGMADAGGQQRCRQRDVSGHVERLIIELDGD